MIWVRSFEPPPVRVDEVVRYMGSRSVGAQELALVESAIAACRDKLQYKACYSVFPLSVEGEKITLPFSQIQSRSLAKNLCGCDRVVIFAATIGLWPDRLVMRCARSEPSKALAVQALGAERIEALCDALQNDLASEFEPQGFSLRPRFSPGYGDCNIIVQRDLFRALDCSRKIGLTLNESMLMSPTKSVTAFIGLGQTQTAAVSSDNRCAGCTQKNCTFRSE